LSASPSSVLLLGMGPQSAGLIITLGFGTDGAQPSTDTSGGYEYALHAPRRRTDEEVREARIRFGVLSLPEAQTPIVAAIAAKARAVFASDVPAKLAAARAQMEAEEAYKRIYQAVYEDVQREDLAELFRLEIAAKLKMKRRRAAMLLLLN
jgi:hypothetical protein